MFHILYQLFEKLELEMNANADTILNKIFFCCVVRDVGSNIELIERCVRSIRHIGGFFVVVAVAGHVALVADVGCVLSEILWNLVNNILNNCNNPRRSKCKHVKRIETGQRNKCGIGRVRQIHPFFDFWQNIHWILQKSI